MEMCKTGTDAYNFYELIDLEHIGYCSVSPRFTCFRLRSRIFGSIRAMFSFCLPVPQKVTSVALTKSSDKNDGFLRWL